MNGPLEVRSPSMVQQRLHLLVQEGSKVKKNRNLGEVAGETAAECAVLWCCGPCAVMNLMVLVVYKLPAGLCRKALRKQRKQQLIAGRNQVSGLLIMPTAHSSLDDGSRIEELLEAATTEENEKVLELEKEMWELFHGTGFWRTPSQKDPGVKLQAH